VRPPVRLRAARRVLAHVVSGDPARPVELTDADRAQARALGVQLAGLDMDLAVATRFLRTRQTVDIALAGRHVPRLIEPRFDELKLGDLDGAPIEDYWQWREHHAPGERFPHGESIDRTLLRHATGLRRLLARPERVVFVVLHEFALRRIVQVAAGPIAGQDAAPATAVPYLFDDAAVMRAADGLEVRANASEAESLPG
jgi:broad specificity phosphatase PhoE